MNINDLSGQQVDLNGFCTHCDTELQNGWCEACDKLINCPFPDCGCDGARLCMAENGANDDAFRCNVEGMYQKGDRKSIAARMDLLEVIDKRNAERGDL